MCIRMYTVYNNVISGYEIRNSQTSGIFQALLGLISTNSRLILKMSKPKYNATVHISTGADRFQKMSEQILSCANMCPNTF